MKQFIKALCILAALGAAAYAVYRLISGYEGGVKRNYLSVE